MLTICAPTRPDTRSYPGSDLPTHGSPDRGDRVVKIGIEDVRPVDVPVLTPAGSPVPAGVHLMEGVAACREGAAGRVSGVAAPSTHLAAATRPRRRDPGTRSCRPAGAGAPSSFWQSLGEAFDDTWYPEDNDR